MERKETDLYALMSRLPVRTGFGAKLFLAAFATAQIPVITLLWLRSFPWPLTDKIIMFVLSLGGGALLMAACLFQLLRPIREAQRILSEFLRDRGEAPGNERLADGADYLRAEIRTLVTEYDRKVSELERDNALDLLTGTLNRRACEGRLQGDLARARRSDVPLTLAFFDMDNLKEVNDEHGHYAGDTCLKLLAETIDGQTREGDWVARWGGDEFLLVLWGSDKHQARGVCDRVLSALRASSVGVDGAHVQVQASAGVCQAGLNDTFESAFQKADAAMLEAKRAGRNGVRVC